MKIVVCVKQVGSLGDEVEFTDDERDVDPDYLDYALNEWDSYATEEALRLREAAGDGEVVAVTVGNEDAEDAMRRALAMGADRGIRVWSDELAGADPITVARALAEVVRAESPDLVFCGVQSSDAVQAATGAALAEVLGLPRAAVVTKLELGNGTATVHRELEGGLVDVVEVDTPALLTIQTGINEPRYATLRAIKQAEEKEIEVREPGDLGTPAARVRRMFVPAKGEGAEMIGGNPAEIAGRIKELVDERMKSVSGVLVVAEHVRGELRPVTLELISAARSLGGPVAVAVIARDPSAFTDAVNVEGVDEILAVRVEQDEFENDVHQSVVEQLIAERSPRAILLGFTVNAMGYGPALAAKLETGFASDVFAVREEGGQLVAERSFYGAKVNGEVEFPGHDRVVLLLRATAWPPAEGAGAAAVTEVGVSPAASRARHKDWVEVQAGDVDITTADFLLSVGRGIGDKENLEQFQELADAMGATLSSSRPLVDSGWMPSARQVGQSGKTVKPKVYIALGISGAVQHLAGMKTSGTIIAINTDPEAAIFNVAHYGAVADLFEVAEELEKLY